MYGKYHFHQIVYQSLSPVPKGKTGGIIFLFFAGL